MIPKPPALVNPQTDPKSPRSITASGRETLSKFIELKMGSQELSWLLLPVSRVSRSSVSPDRGITPLFPFAFLLLPFALARSPRSFPLLLPLLFPFLLPPLVAVLRSESACSNTKLHRSSAGLAFRLNLSRSMRTVNAKNNCEFIAKNEGLRGFFRQAPWRFHCNRLRGSIRDSGWATF